MKLTDALKGFELFANAGNYSPLTYAPYKLAIIKVSEFLHDPDIEKITENDLLGFMAYLRTQYKPGHADNASLSEASMHRYWKAIRAFFKWSSVKLGTGRPDLTLTIPKYDSKEIAPFSKEEVKRLLAVCDNSAVIRKTDKKEYHLHRTTALRDRCIIRTLLDTGVRVGELCRLRVIDVSFESGAITVLPHRKGKTRARVIPIGDKTKQDLWLYVAKRKEVEGELRNNSPFFVVDEGKPLSPHRVESMLTYLGTRAKVPSTHPHRFRHTFAIEYLRGGGDVFTLRYILGHATMDMVRHYLTLAQADVEAAHRRASPVDNWRL